MSNWSNSLPASIDLLGVQYPNWTGAAVRTPQAIADKLLDELQGNGDLPLILFGYSLGALIAYEAAVRLSQDGLAPAALIVAASRAPHIRKRPPISHLPDVDFIAKVRGFGGTSEAVLADRQLMHHFLPTLRADFATAENYEFSPPSAPLSCPIAAIAGDADQGVDTDAVEGWKLHTAKSFSMHRLSGGHFFLHTQREAVVAIVRDVAERFEVRANVCVADNA